MAIALLRRAPTSVALVFFLSMLAGGSADAANTCESAASGNWSASATWLSCAGGVPQPGDTVTINAPHTVALDISTAPLAGLAIGSGASLTNDGSHSATLNIADGGWSNNGAFYPGGLVTVAFAGSSSSSIGGSAPTSFYRLQRVSGSGTTTLQVNAIVSDTLTLMAGTLAVGANTLTLYSSVSNNGAVSGDSGTVILAGAGSHTLSGSGAYNFHDLKIDASGGTINLSTSVTIHVGGDFTKSAGSFNCVSKSDALSNSCTLDFNGAGTSSLSWATSSILPWNITVQPGTTVNLGSSNSTFTLRGDLGGGGLLIAAGGTITFDTVTTANLAGVKNLYNVVVSSPTTLTLAANANMGFKGTFTLNPGGAFDAISNSPTTVTIAGANPQSLPVGAAALRNLTINSGATLNAPLALSLAGDFADNGAFTPGASTVTFNGVTQTLTGNTTFNNLTTNAGTTLDTGASLATVNGTLINQGALKHTTPAQNVTHGGTFIFVDAVNMTTAQLTQTGGADMGSTTVTVTAHITPTNYACGSTTLGGTPVRRLFNITPTTTAGVTADVTLYYYDGSTGAGDEANGNALSNLAIYHCDGTMWTRFGGPYTTGGTAPGYQWVKLTGVTAFSPFAIGGGPSAPTAVVLSNFVARQDSATAPRWVTLAWTTASEIHTAGFNLYRSENLAGPYVQINPRLIPGSADVLTGGAYQFIDMGAASNLDYYYQLEEVELNGATTRHPPIRVTP